MTEALLEMEKKKHFSSPILAILSTVSLFQNRTRTSFLFLVVWDLSCLLLVLLCWGLDGTEPCIH